MKKLFFVFILTSFSFLASAQLGIKVGLAATSIDTSSFIVNNPNDTFKVGLKNVKSALQLGISYRIGLGSLYIQPELMFNSNTSNYTVGKLNTNILDTLKSENFQYLDIPIMVGLKTSFFRFNAGPVGHVLVSNKSDLLDYKNYSQNFSTITWGFQAGIGVDLGSFTIDGRYEGDFTDYGNHINFGSQNFNFAKKPARIMVQVGFKF
jgi:hypothetical protein